RSRPGNSSDGAIPAHQMPRKPLENWGKSTKTGGDGCAALGADRSETAWIGPTRQTRVFLRLSGALGIYPNEADWPVFDRSDFRPGLAAKRRSAQATPPVALTCVCRPVYGSLRLLRDSGMFVGPEWLLSRPSRVPVSARESDYY